MPRGMVFAINDQVVSCPDEDTLSPIVIGEATSGLQKRSPYRLLTWRKNIGGRCDMDWFDHDNTRLISLHTRSIGKVDEYTRFTDVVCQSVTKRNRRQLGTEIVATFLVR